MRRLLVIVLPALFIAAGGGMSATPASGQAPPTPTAPPIDREDLRRGLIYDGLRRVSEHDVCRGNFRLETVTVRGMPVCTHGPDPAPEGVDVRAERQPSPALQTAPAGTVPCVGDGRDGHRVQLVYARAADRPDGYAQWLPSMQEWAARIDDVFNASAAETGGVRHVRFVHDAGCVPVIAEVVLSTTGDDNFDNTVAELQSRGFTRSDRKYLVWTDANVYCGIAQVWYDDSPGPDNTSNGNPEVAGGVGRVDRGCWGLDNLTEAHELAHLLGAVQRSSPNATAGSHCTDDYDRLCYSDGTAFASIVCGDAAHENRLDCNHDDYYSTAPAPGSYLDTHWNVANSRFLVDGGASPDPPPPSTTTTTAPRSSFWPPWWFGTTTTTTAPPATTTTQPPTTAAPTTAAPTTAAPTTAAPTTAPPGPTAAAPSAPRNLFATQPAGTGARGVVLSWSPPAAPGTPPFTAYRVYRGTGSSALTLLAEVGAGSTSFHDTTAVSRQLYWYAVTAVNSAGESPPSGLTRMIAK